MKCRICGSTKNLKYSPAEIPRTQKSKRLPLPLKEIANANGNICRFCESRLENFHKEDSPVEIDITDDERFCEMFYKRHYGRCEGSDGDPEVIEVLTSRETTPDIAITEVNQNGRLPLGSNAIIVDVIDLEDDESSDNAVETVSQCSKEIRHENLLGCLNLVTSDSESSEIHFEPCVKANVIKEETPSKHISSSMQDDNVTSQNTFPVCEVCGIRFLDIASQQVHMKDIHQLPCPVCTTQFKTKIDLVYHIRQKHRQYNGDKLCEGSRCAQDSAMTIRLRYEQASTFYECQLCGLIDSQFKAHKDHIIQNHPDESKSLRDPMMKTKLNCPACHQKIGTHHVDVCRHMLLKHPEKCKKYIKEVTDLNKLSFKNPNTLQKIKASARILSFIDKDENFYECQLCKKIWGNIQCFIKHLNVHNIDEWAEYEARKFGNKVAPSDSNLRSKRKTDEHKLNNIKQQKQMILPKNKKYVEVSQKPKHQTTKKSISSKDAIKLQKQDGMFKKPLNQILSIEATSEIENKRQKKLKRRSKNNAPMGDGALKVKVKPPLRHFPTQKYDCKHCQSTFKGFRKLNLHLMTSHTADEFLRCMHCTHLFTSKFALAHHVRCLHTDPSKPKSKRKLASNSADNEKVDENFNQECSSKRPRLVQSTEGDSSKVCNENVENQPKWLNELFEISLEKKKKMCNLESSPLVIFKELNKLDKEQLQNSAQKVCKYCARLFAMPSELFSHEKLHTEAKHMPWIDLRTLTQQD